MTIDERLEALTQTVELLAHESEAMQRRHEDLRATVHSLGNYVNEIAEGTARLLHIAQIHEHRLEKLEGGAD